MKTPIAVRPSNALYNWLMLISGFTFMLVLLPFLRCLLDGKTYSWGMQVFGMSFFSKGIQPDYFVLIPLLAFYLFYYYSFYWIKNRNLFYISLIAWWLLNFGNLLYDIVKNGDTVFHGDTLDIHISLTNIIVPFSIITMVWIIWIVFRERKIPTVAIPWAKKNKQIAFLLLSLLPIQAVLLGVGNPHGLTDKIGVVTIVLQAFAIAFVFIPAKQKNQAKTGNDL